MKKFQFRAAFLPLLMAPAAALAFETVDTLPWPSSGRFPAYPREEVRPTDLWVQGGVMRDDNLLRRETDEQADTVSRIGAGFRHEQRIVGRQRVLVEARGDAYKFDRFSELDHFAYSALGTWLWEVGNALSGTVVVGRDRRLADLGETLVPRRDMLTTTRLAATAGYMVTPSLRARGGVARDWGDSSTRPETETRATAATIGADYVTPLGNALGAEYRTARGEAPVSELVAPASIFVSDDYREHEVALVGTYRPGPFLRTEGRIGRTKRTYNDIPGRDFNGTTGRARIEWLPGNKTILAFEAYKVPRSILDVGASHFVVKGIGFGPSWAATAKLVFSGRFIRERRRFEGDPAITLVGAPVRDEVLSLVRFGVGWEPLRHWQAGFAYDHGKRDSNLAGRDYNYNAFTANLAWRW